MKKILENTFCQYSAANLAFLNTFYSNFQRIVSYEGFFICIPVGKVVASTRWLTLDLQTSQKLKSFVSIDVSLNM